MVFLILLKRPLHIIQAGYQLRLSWKHICCAFQQQNGNNTNPNANCVNDSDEILTQIPIQSGSDVFC